MMRLLRILGLVLPMVGWTSFSSAYTISPEGKVSFDADAVLTESFDTAVGTGFSLSTKDPLEGSGSVLVSGQSSYAIAYLPWKPTGKGAYKFRVFTRQSRVHLGLSLGGNDPRRHFMAMAFPTGRVTSDGWVELESGTFHVDPSSHSAMRLVVSGTGAEIDAFEIIKSGSYRTPIACSPPDASPCEEGDSCQSGFCSPAELVLPPLPSVDERAFFAQLLAGRAELFFGGVYTREHRLPQVLDEFHKMETAATRGAYWNGLAQGIHAMHDSHTWAMNGASLASRAVLPVCFVEGLADRSHAQAPSKTGFRDVLVSHGINVAGKPWLSPGDRLVAVNGMHPIEFYQSLKGHAWHLSLSSDANAHGLAVEGLAELIPTWATNVTVIRCDKTTGVCSAPERLDVAKLPIVDASDAPSCDHRPAYHLSQGGPSGARAQLHRIDQDVFHGVLVESQEDEALWGMVFNYTKFNSNGSNPYKKAYDDIRVHARGLVLDHRSGGGGTADVVEYLTTLMRPRELFSASLFVNLSYGLLDPPFTNEQGMAIFNKIASTQGLNVGAWNARTDLPVAVLLARDLSGSDFFPAAIKGQPNVRLFGTQTDGAFSSYRTFSYFGFMMWSMASGDLFRPNGEAYLGHGVIPDEVIVPSQSDLMNGKDTAHERAVAWLREMRGAQ